MMGHGDVVTSWTLALYIVTTAAGGFPNQINANYFADEVKRLLH